MSNLVCELFVLDPVLQFSIKCLTHLLAFGCDSITVKFKSCISFSLELV